MIIICPNCKGGFAGRPRSHSAIVRLTFVSLVKCRTGDCDKYKCPVCRGTFFFSSAGEVEDFEAGLGRGSPTREKLTEILQRANAAVG